MNCLLTGGTGILGSHIIFEWLRKAMVEQSVDHLFLIIRSNHKTANERLLSILEDESRPAYLDNFTLKDCLEKITVVDADLAHITTEILGKYNFDTIIHCAGSTSLSQSQDSKSKVHNQNLLVTRQLLNELPVKVNRFIYISTAYSFGIQDKMVCDTIENYDVTSFRNAYEQSKYESESHVKDFCILNGIEYQILRPSIICGRLIDKPFFETPKFDVFYSWAIFLDKYAKKSDEKFRIWIDQNSGLNIVPVDFVSKAILHAFVNPTIKELNIVNPKPILHKNYVGKVLEYFNIHSFEFIQNMPVNLNVFETLYYKSIGVIFEKYISIPDLQFNHESILNLIDELGLDKTLGVHENFINLIDFSVEKKFRRSYI